PAPYFHHSIGGNRREHHDDHCGPRRRRLPPPAQHHSTAPDHGAPVPRGPCPTAAGARPGRHFWCHGTPPGAGTTTPARRPDLPLGVPRTPAVRPAGTREHRGHGAASLVGDPATDRPPTGRTEGPWTRAGAAASRARRRAGRRERGRNTAGRRAGRAPAPSTGGCGLRGGGRPRSRSAGARAPAAHVLA